MSKRRYMICSVCAAFVGCFEQWLNRDDGFGICSRCARSEKSALDPEEMRSNYGVEGVNYSLGAPREANPESDSGLAS